MSVVLVVPFDRAPPPSLAPDFTALPRGSVLALIDNGKVNADRLLSAIGDALVERGAVASYFLYRKQRMVPLTDAERDDILARAQVVIAGLGDCGGCTACSVTDALRCAGRGVPSFILATERFEGIVDATEREYGRGALRRLYVGHPVWNRDDEWFESTAEALAARCAETFGSEKLLSGDHRHQR